jgi:hypothetical protein
VTSYGNDRAGVRAVGATGGFVEHSTAWGNGEAGFEIDLCGPCRTVVTDSQAEHNSTGFSATNASGDLYVVNSTFRMNRVGIALVSDDDRSGAPQSDATIAGNLVADNNDTRTPPTDTGGFGVGIVVAGGKGDRIERNRVSGHSGVGIAVTDARRRAPRDNVVRGNVIERNKTDLAFFLVTVASTAAKGNCFALNRADVTAPAGIERLLRCGDHASLPESLPPPVFPSAPTGVAPSEVPAPAAEGSMPDAATAPAAPADQALPRIDVSVLSIPAEPATAG